MQQLPSSSLQQLRWSIWHHPELSLTTHLPVMRWQMSSDDGLDYCRRKTLKLKEKMDVVAKVSGWGRSLELRAMAADSFALCGFGAHCVLTFLCALGA